MTARYIFFVLWASSGWCKFFHRQATTRWLWWQNCNMTSTWHFHLFKTALLVLCIIFRLGLNLTLHLLFTDTLTMHSCQLACHNYSISMPADSSTNVGFLNWKDKSPNAFPSYFHMHHVDFPALAMPWTRRVTLGLLQWPQHLISVFYWPHRRHSSLSDFTFSIDTSALIFIIHTFIWSVIYNFSYFVLLLGFVKYIIGCLIPNMHVMKEDIITIYIFCLELSL